jgi:hypothetical protein
VTQGRNRTRAAVMADKKSQAGLSDAAAGITGCRRIWSSAPDPLKKRHCNDKP